MRKVKFATVGLGRMGCGHIREMLGSGRAFELAAVCDHAPERLAKPFIDIGAARRYAAIGDLLNNPEVDLVTLATRHCDHVPMAMQVLESGRYCVVEKPVASSVAEMRQLQACAEKYPGKLMLRHNRRFEAPFVKARELIAGGKLGRIHYIKLYRSVGYARRNDWMTMPEFYGGLLSNWGPHLIDQALRLLDAKVVDVWADVRHCISIGAGDDMFKLLLRAANGRLADIEVSGANAMPGREMEIIGERGTIAYEPGATRLHVRMLDPDLKPAALKPHPENPPFAYGNFDETLSFVDADYDLPKVGSVDMWKYVYDAIVGKAAYPISFDEGLEVVRITEEAIRRSGFAPLQRFVAS